MECETLLLGVTGSVGAVQAHHYVSHLRRHFADNIYVIMSRAAQQFVTPYSLQLFSGNPVFTDSFETKAEINVPHIELVQKASLLLILPATANILGKAAAGLCDDLLSTTIIACRAPIVFAPNMNEVMWSNPIVQRNVETLKAVGHYIIEPVEGVEIADMRPGGGAMPPLETVMLSLKLIMAANGSTSDAQSSEQQS